MDATIFLYLMQDGLTNGAIYALLGLALVVVFSVTRVIFIPQGEFVAYGALTYAILSLGKIPGTVWLALGFGAAAFVFDLRASRPFFKASAVLRSAAWRLAVPCATLIATRLLAGPATPALVNALLTLAMVAPMGPNIYRIAFQPMAEASVLTLLIAAVGVHLAMLGTGLVIFGAEGLRAPPMSEVQLTLGPLLILGQSLDIYGVTLAAIAALWLLFEHTLAGKALRATAVNRIGARLVGISTALSGSLAFGIAALIGALSGILIVPVTTIYYDTGFLIGLKGFVAAIIGGLASFPLTGVAALIVGIVEASASFFASNFKEVIVFMLILPVLVWRSVRSDGAGDDE